MLMSPLPVVLQGIRCRNSPLRKLHDDRGFGWDDMADRHSWSTFYDGRDRLGRDLSWYDYIQLWRIFCFLDARFEHVDFNENAFHKETLPRVDFPPPQDICFILK